MYLKNLLLLIFFSNAGLLAAQPQEFEKFFHPQTDTEIGVMKKSPQKMVIAYSVSEDFMNGDTANYINGVKKYDANGRLIFNDDYRSGNLIKYNYDSKGRVTEYFEDNGAENATLHFAITYAQKGGIESIENKAANGKTISYNKNTQAILITEQGGYIYRYTIDNENRLVRVETEYYESKPYNSALTYNKKGQVIEEKGSREENDNMVNFTVTYTYSGEILVKVEDKTNIPNSETQKGYVTTYTYTEGLLEYMEFTTPESKETYSYIYDKQKRVIQTNYFENDGLYGQEFYVYR